MQAQPQIGHRGGLVGRYIAWQVVGCLGALYTLVEDDILYGVLRTRSRATFLLPLQPLGPSPCPIPPLSYLPRFETGYFSPMSLSLIPSIVCIHVFLTWNPFVFSSVILLSTLLFFYNSYLVSQQKNNVPCPGYDIYNFSNDCTLWRNLSLTHLIEHCPLAQPCSQPSTHNLAQS